jgi:hypothetical protein
MQKLMLSLLAIALALVTAAPVAASSGNATVYIIHGIPGKDINALLGASLPADLPVDVSVNGGCALQSFRFRQIVGPLSLPAGAYDIAISVANPAHPCSNAAVISVNDLPLNAGESASIIAHLNTQGAPTASKFINNVSATQGLNGRVAVRHTANAPAVDVKVNTLLGLKRLNATLPNLSNGNQAEADLPLGIYQASLFAAGTDARAFGPALVVAFPQTFRAVYAVGSLQNGTFTLITQTIRLR